ncbi:MAG: 30S ribosome-binding factor RbfA [Oscillospiraceae bacterium]|nr:30S ribosome-binding factor RbfA [Oscillospiraceae bacterium]
MASNRLPKINEDIQRTLAALLCEIKDPRVKQGILSITAVDTAGDLSRCKVYVSALGHSSDAELKKGLQSASGYLRRELGQSLRLRRAPELIFLLDGSIEHGARINKILKELE